MNMEIIQLKQRKKAFINAANIVNSMAKYELYLTDKTKLQLECLVEFSNGMPLPSGRWGNAIALALETNHYISANHLIENATKLNLETSTVVSELGGKNAWSLKDEYLYSLLTFDEKEFELVVSDNIIKHPNEKETYIEYLQKTKLAIKSIEQKLNITSNEKSLIKK